MNGPIRESSRPFTQPADKELELGPGPGRNSSAGGGDGQLRASFVRLSEEAKNSRRHCRRKVGRLCNHFSSYVRIWLDTTTCRILHCDFRVRTLRHPAGHVKLFPQAADRELAAIGDNNGREKSLRVGQHRKLSGSAILYIRVSG